MAMDSMNGTGIGNSGRQPGGIGRAAPVINAGAGRGIAPGAKPPLRVVLAGPRGFCAGVDRAIRVVEEALRRYGAPVYVRHEIVHNRPCRAGSAGQGRGVRRRTGRRCRPTRHVVFSRARRAEIGAGRGAAPQARSISTPPARWSARSIARPSATSPRRPEQRHILMIGHAGHPEVEGTMGQLPPGAMTLVQNAAEARTVPRPTRSAWPSSPRPRCRVDDTAEIVDILRAPLSPHRRTQARGHLLRHHQPPVGGEGDRPGLRPADRHRQPQLSATASACARSPSAPARARAILLPPAASLDWSALDGVTTLGLTAGASAPEAWWSELLDRAAQPLRDRGRGAARHATRTSIFKLAGAARPS